MNAPDIKRFVSSLVEDDGSPPTSPAAPTSKVRYFWKWNGTYIELRGYTYQMTVGDIIQVAPSVAEKFGALSGQKTDPDKLLYGSNIGFLWDMRLPDDARKASSSGGDTFSQWFEEFRAKANQEGWKESKSR